MRRLPFGKLPVRVLDSTVLRMTGAHSRALTTPPKAGLDFAAIKLDGGYMIVSADPVTGVAEGIGRSAVIVSANDVATSGNRAQFAESVVLLPKSSTERDIEAIAAEMHRTARSLGISIVGGHTEVTPGLGRPIVVVTAFSFVKSYISSEDAMTGDTMMMTKTAAIEGTAAAARENLTLRKLVPGRFLDRARGFVSKMSIVEEGVAAHGTGYVHAMHDCTEGGVLGAVFEMSVASGLGFVLREDAIPVARETRLICEALSLDPIRLIGSGSLLLSVERGKEALLKEALRPVCRVTTIGEFRKGRKTLVRKDGKETTIRSAPVDELWRALRRPS